MRKLVFAALLLFLLAPPVVAAPAWDFELGQQVTIQSTAWYGQARCSVLLGEIRALDTQLWVMPEVGLVGSLPLQGYARVQVLADAPVATVGLEAKAEIGRPSYLRMFVRFGF